MKGVDPTEFAALAVGRGPDGSALCIRSKFMSSPGYNDVSYYSHPDGETLTVHELNHVGLFPRLAKKFM